MPDLTPNQLDAIDYRRQDACVIAGPGSGKTTVLVERYRVLIEDYRLEPRQILAITFTEKAAANMKAKLAEMFSHDALRLRELESAYVSTIHGFCARILRENAIAAEVDPRFSVLDARESEDLQYACMNAALDEMVAQRRAEALQLIAALHAPAQIAANLQCVYDAMRSAGRSIDQVRAMPNPGMPLEAPEMAARLRQLLANWPSNLSLARRTQRDELLDWAQRLAHTGASPLEDVIALVKECPLNLGRVPDSEKVVLREFKAQLQELRAAAVARHTAPLRALIFETLMRFEDLYNGRKRERASLDFNDLERLTVNLLGRSGQVRDRIRSQFRQVMLDEFQDINEQQSELIELVRGEDVFFGVGDTNQSIYGFRHARPEIFLDYRTEIENLGKHTAELLHNFRSRKEILLCVETLLHAAEGIKPRDLIARARFHPKPEPSIEVLKIHGDATNDADEAAAREARWIAHRILTLHHTLRIGEAFTPRLADFGDFAVLCRNGESMKPILEAFDQARIPYVSGRRQSFLLSREGRDITALLHAIANPRDAISLVTVLRSGLVGLSDESLLRIRVMGGSVPGGLNVIAHDSSKLGGFSEEEAGKLQRLIGNLSRWRADQAVVPLEVLIVRALTDCGFEWLPDTVAGENIESFLRLARIKGSNGNLLEFLNELESVQGSVNLESDLSDKDQGDRVQVMTAHSAKGLEFPITIVAAMDKGVQRNSAPVTFTPAFGLGLKWKNPCDESGKSGLEDAWQLRNEMYLDERDAQETNRLLYVATTRAQEHLILSYSRTKNRPQGWAKLVDTAFQLDSRVPSSKPVTETIVPAIGKSFEALMLVADDDPASFGSTSGEPVHAGDVEAIPRPVIDDQHDSTVNVTSLAIFAKCPRKYYLQRYIGWGAAARPPEDFSDVEDLPESEYSAADVGSMVHEILAGKAAVGAPEAHRLADVFLHSDLGGRAASAARSEREWSFVVDLDGTLVRGSIDLWFEQDGALHIVDYKTDAISAAETHKRAVDYAAQLALYGLALERAFGKRPCRGYLHFLRPDEVVEMELDEAAFQSVRALLMELRAAQNDLRFDLRQDDHCRSCQFYRDLCPAGLASHMHPAVSQFVPN